jgi:hypothetical protein
VLIRQHWISWHTFKVPVHLNRLSTVPDGHCRNLTPRPPTNKPAFEVPAACHPSGFSTVLQIISENVADSTSQGRPAASTEMESELSVIDPVFVGKPAPDMVSRVPPRVDPVAGETWSMTGTV